MEWKPIETAPRDGTNILMWEPDDRFQFVGFFNKASGESGLFCHDDGSWVESQPTHWMPLPEPPND